MRRFFKYWFLFGLFFYSIIGLSQDSVSDTLLADELILLAKAKLDLFEYDSAEYYAEQGLRKSRRVFYRIGKAEAQLVMAEIELHRDDLTAAIRDYFGASKEYEMLGDTLEMALVNIQIGEVFDQAQLFGKALEYFLKAELLMKDRIPDKEPFSRVKWAYAATSSENNFPALNLYPISAALYFSGFSSRFGTVW